MTTGASISLMYQGLAVSSLTGCIHFLYLATKPEMGSEAVLECYKGALSCAISFAGWSALSMGNPIGAAFHAVSALHSLTILPRMSFQGLTSVKEAAKSLFAEDESSDDEYQPKRRF